MVALRLYLTLCDKEQTEEALKEFLKEVRQLSVNRRKIMCDGEQVGAVAEFADGSEIVFDFESCEITATGTANMKRLSK